MTTMTKPIDKALVYLLERGATSAKELARLYEKSESRMREILKQHQPEIMCKKNEAGVNVFWLVPNAASPKPEQAPPPADKPVAKVTKAKNPDAPDHSANCPLCNADESEQTQAGPDGTYLGACLTCGECGKTYNVLTRDEIDMPAKADKAKRKPLNPQYKIDLKVDAVKAAGGKLVYEREARQWVPTKANHDPKRMSAQEFSIETPESLISAIS